MPASSLLHIEFDTTETDFAAILVARSKQGVCAILLGDSVADLYTDLAQRFPKAQLQNNTQGLAALLKNLTNFLENPQTPLNFCLDIQGSAFQQQVWSVLRSIPVGHTLSYTDVAELLHKPSAVRAVANACAANPLALAIPCHRILRADGSISGYRWGVERKRELLAREQLACS